MRWSIIGENISTDIMDNCKELINNIEKQTIKILEDNRGLYGKYCSQIVKKETITYKEIKSLVP